MYKNVLKNLYSTKTYITYVTKPNYLARTERKRFYVKFIILVLNLYLKSHKLKTFTVQVD